MRLLHAEFSTSVCRHAAVSATLLALVHKFCDVMVMIRGNMFALWLPVVCRRTYMC